MPRVSFSAADDETLWRAFLQGDEAAYAQLYRHYVEKLYSYGRHFAADEELLRDAIQELFVDLWRWRSTLAETTSVKYYLFRSLRRRIRSATTADRFTDPLEDWQEASAAVPSPEEARLEREQEALDLSRLRWGILQLPPRQQEVLRLRYFEEFSWSEIADIMQVNEQSVRNLVQRAVHKLQQLFGLLSVALWLQNGS